MPWVFRFPQFIDVSAAKPWFQQSEALFDRAVRYVLLIRVPADGDLGMICGLHHFSHSRRPARFAPVNFDPDLDASAFCELATFTQRRADLRDRLLFRNLSRYPVRAYFHADRADVLGQLDKTFTLVNVVSND